MRCMPLMLLVFALGCVRPVWLAAQQTPAPEVLLDEPFEDANWAARGWYDGPRMELNADEHMPGSTLSCQWRWAKKGDIGIAGPGARVRFRPVSNVTISFAIKHSADWKWTGVPYHPHMFYFLTDVDDAYLGPAYSHLTCYVEAVNGRPHVAVQDGRNIDVAHLRGNLVGVTESRAVAGGNGDSDGYGEGGAYRNGDLWFNGKAWETREVYFTETPGPQCQTDWHQIKAKFQLNTIRDGIGQKDGIIQYWYDGQLAMDYHDVVFRTGQHPTMKFNQFLMGPYYGPGVPHPQSIYIDNLLITTEPNASER